jgi:endonuclease YncB( thermonuclease family)
LFFFSGLTVLRRTHRANREMSKASISFFILLLVVLLGIQGVRVFGWEIDQTSKASGIVDGDTFYIPNDRVRLADVNAPELGDEPGYSRAKNALSDLIDGKTVYLDTDDKSGRDQYGRIIAVVYVIFNSTHYLNVNEALIDQGVADAHDYTDNEFHYSTWTLYVRYENSPSSSTLVESLVLIGFIGAILMASIYLIFFKILPRKR